MVRYTKADLWGSEHCPLPTECHTRRNYPKASCEELNAVTHRATLSEHIRLTGTKQQFHALANPGLRPADRAWAANGGVDSIYSLAGLLANPNLRRADLPDSEGWSYTFLSSVLTRRKDLIRSKDIDYCAAGSSRTIWYSLLDAGIEPRTETVLLEKGTGFHPVRARWAEDARASEGYLTACLTSVAIGSWALFDKYLKLYRAAALNPNTPIATLFTAGHVNDQTDSFLVEALWERETEAEAWVAENHPELSDVPLDWVRATLSQ